MHLTSVLFGRLPLLILRSLPLPGPAWPHHGRGALHLCNEFPSGWREGSGGCRARGDEGGGGTLTLVEQRSTFDVTVPMSRAHLGVGAAKGALASA